MTTFLALLNFYSSEEKKFDVLRIAFGALRKTEIDRLHPTR